jgi:hypothetical protein
MKNYTLAPLFLLIALTTALPGMNAQLVPKGSLAPAPRSATILPPPRGSNKPATIKPYNKSGNVAPLPPKKTTAKPPKATGTKKTTPPPKASGAKKSPAKASLKKKTAAKQPKTIKSTPSAKPKA